MKAKILYIVIGILLGITGFWIFYVQINVDPKNKEAISTEEGILTNDPSNESQTIAASEPNLADFEGVWRVVKYEKDNVSNIDFGKSDNYAEQFSRYASFIISEDVMEVSRRCEEKVYIAKIPSVLTDTNNDERVPFVLHFTPRSEYIYFIKPKNQSYKGPCSEGYNALYIYNDQLVIADMGYFFYFERGKPESDYIIWGTPGDIRSDFVVTRNFENSSLQEVYAQFLEDFPYEKEYFTLNELPSDDYSVIKENRIISEYEYLINGDLLITRDLLYENTSQETQMVMLSLTHTDNDIVRLRYFIYQCH